VEGRDIDRNKISSQTTTNLVLTYRGETSTDATWTTSFNVTNLFDRDAPIVPSFSQRGGQQNISGQHDSFGRRYQLSLDYNF
jgi:outer membrane receptor protein involved in Fe transport